MKFPAVALAGPRPEPPGVCSRSAPSAYAAAGWSFIRAKSAPSASPAGAAGWPDSGAYDEARRGAAAHPPAVCMIRQDHAFDSGFSAPEDCPRAFLNSRIRTRTATFIDDSSPPPRTRNSRRSSTATALSRPVRVRGAPQTRDCRAARDVFHAGRHAHTKVPAEPARATALCFRGPTCAAPGRFDAALPRRGGCRRCRGASRCAQRRVTCGSRPERREKCFPTPTPRRPDSIGSTPPHGIRWRGAHGTPAARIEGAVPARSRAFAGTRGRSAHDHRRPRQPTSRPSTTISGSPATPSSSIRAVTSANPAASKHRVTSAARPAMSSTSHMATAFVGKHRFE